MLEVEKKASWERLRTLSKPRRLWVFLSLFDADSWVPKKTEESSPRGGTMFFVAVAAVAAVGQHFKCWLSELTISQSDRKNASYHL